MPQQNNMSMSYSPATLDLGLGDLLGQQTKDETDEMRKKRMQQMQMGGGGVPSLATMALFGGGAGGLSR